MKKIPLMKPVSYKGEKYIIGDFFKGKYKIMKPGQSIWVTPKQIKMGL